MFDLEWKSNVDDVMRYIDGLPRNVVLPAMVDALNWTAYDVRLAEQDEMRRVFDDPAPWTINSMMVDKASTSDPVAGVGWKETGARTPAGRYLIPQVKGGPRPPTPFEFRLIANGKLRSGEFLVPSRFAERNARGDLNPGQITKILSDLGSIDTARSYPGARNRGRRALETYYVDRTSTVPGIYLNRGARRRLLVFVIVRQPTYRPIFDFEGVAKRYEKANFADKFARALARRLTGPLKRKQ